MGKVPYFDAKMTMTMTPHVNNVRPQDSKVEEYVEFVRQFGVCPGCRGQPWAVWSGPSKDLAVYPLQMIT